MLGGGSFDDASLAAEEKKIGASARNRELAIACVVQSRMAADIGIDYGERIGNFVETWPVRQCILSRFSRPRLTRWRRGGRPD